MILNMDGKKNNNELPNGLTMIDDNKYQHYTW